MGTFSVYHWLVVIIGICLALVAITKQQKKKALKVHADRALPTMGGELMTPYSNPKGVGGWLTLLIVGLIILGPLLGFVRIGADFLRIEDTSPSLRSNADWQALKEATWTLFLVCAGFSIAAGYRLWRYHDSSSVKFAIISLWGLPVAFVVGQLLIIDWLYPSHMLTDDIAKSLFQLFGIPRFIDSPKNRLPWDSFGIRDGA